MKPCTVPLPMKPRQMYPRRRHQRSQPGDEVQRVEHDVRRSVRSRNSLSGFSRTGGNSIRRTVGSPSRRERCSMPYRAQNLAAGSSSSCGRPVRSPRPLPRDSVDRALARSIFAEAERPLRSRRRVLLRPVARACLRGPIRAAERLRAHLREGPWNGRRRSRNEVVGGNGADEDTERDRKDLTSHGPRSQRPSGPAG